MRYQSKVLRIDLLHDRLSDVFRRIQIAGEQLFIFKTYLEFAFEPFNEFKKTVGIDEPFSEEVGVIIYLISEFNLEFFSDELFDARFG